MSNTISEDEFIKTLVSLLERELYIVSEDHVWFRSNDLNVMIHAWYEDGFYSGGSSERLSPPGTSMWADSLTPVKQWLLMYNFDLLRYCLGLEYFDIRFRELLIAPNWSHRPGPNQYSLELCHNDQPTGVFAGKWSDEATNLTWFLNHTPERLLEIAHIEDVEEACQALFGTTHIPFNKEDDRHRIALLSIQRSRRPRDH